MTDTIKPEALSEGEMRCGASPMADHRDTTPTVLTLELVVECEPDRLHATKELASWRDAIPLISEFLVTFGEPDKGPQEIRITLSSQRSAS